MARSAHPRGTVQRLGRWMGFGVGAYVATVGLVTVAAVTWPDATPPRPADAIICLGAAADAEGLSPYAEGRAIACADLYVAGAAPQIVFTGIVAAPIMADVARERGVPDGAILVEAASRSTLQNALFTARVVPDAARVIVVSDAFHMPRSWASFRVMGFEDVALAPSGTARLVPLQILREALATWFNAGRTLVWWATPWLPDDTRAALLI